VRDFHAINDNADLLELVVSRTVDLGLGRVSACIILVNSSEQRGGAFSKLNHCYFDFVTGLR